MTPFYSYVIAIYLTGCVLESSDTSTGPSGVGSSRSFDPRDQSTWDLFDSKDPSSWGTFDPEDPATWGAFNPQTSSTGYFDSGGTWHKWIDPGGTWHEWDPTHTGPPMPNTWDPKPTPPPTIPPDHVIAKFNGPVKSIDIDGPATVDIKAGDTTDLTVSYSGAWTSNFNIGFRDGTLTAKNSCMQVICGPLTSRAGALTISGTFAGNMLSSIKAVEEVDLRIKQSSDPWLSVNEMTIILSGGAVIKTASKIVGRGSVSISGSQGCIIEGGAEIIAPKLNLDISQASIGHDFGRLGNPIMTPYTSQTFLKMSTVERVVVALSKAGAVAVTIGFAQSSTVNLGAATWLSGSFEMSSDTKFQCSNQIGGGSISNVALSQSNIDFSTCFAR